MSTYKESFIDAVNSANQAASGGSEDAELNALREAVETAQGWLSTMDLISFTEYGDQADEQGE